MDLKEADILGEDIESHWYYRSKAKALTAFIDDIPKTQILDIGAGSGFFSDHILKNSSATSSICVDISYDKEFDMSSGSKTLHFRKSIDKTEADLVLLMDVLEHVKDDVGLLREYVAKVPSGANFLISVPAFQWLWSAHDVFLEHERRYTLNQIEDVVKSSGLGIVRGSYFFTAVLPIAALTRIAQRMFGKDEEKPESQLKKHSSLTNSVLSNLSEIDFFYLKNNRVAGLTIFCLAKKA